MDSTLWIPHCGRRDDERRTRIVGLSLIASTVERPRTLTALEGETEQTSDPHPGILDICYRRRLCNKKVQPGVKFYKLNAKKCILHFSGILFGKCFFNVFWCQILDVEILSV